MTLGLSQIPVGVFTCVPLLMGIKTFRRLQAVLDCHHDALVLGAVDPNRGVKLCAILPGTSFRSETRSVGTVFQLVTTQEWDWCAEQSETAHP